MADPISNYGRINLNGPGDRRDLDRTERINGAAGSVRPPAAQGPATTRRVGEDELILSDAARQIADRETFDPAKVEAIKRAISDGNYPLDTRRIAENFLAIERLL